MSNYQNMFVTREFRPSDFNFVANSYLRSYRSGPEAKYMPSDFYYPEYKEKLTHMIKTGKVTILCSSQDEDQIVGYSITDKILDWNILHYVYIKFTFRRMGLAKQLLADLSLGQNVTICTHIPKMWSNCITKYKLAFDPKYARP